MSYDAAARELYQAPHAAFVTERKRLAGELKAAGDKAAATKLGKLPRPPISAWAVNQLWWHARAAFEKFLETAERLREGDLGANAAHREALAALRQRAAGILSEAGNAAAESTLRRIQTTLSAIAASGGFDPDPPGMLSEDRDPPGFEAAGIPGLAASVKEPKPDAGEDDGAARSRKEAAEAKRQADAKAKEAAAEAAAERRKAEQAAAKRAAERHRHEAALRTAKGEVERRQRELDRLKQAVEEAEAAVEKSQGIVGDLEAKLAELAD